MARLGLVLDDSELQQRVKEDIYAVLKNPVRGAAAGAAACAAALRMQRARSDAGLLLRRSTSTTPGRTSMTWAGKGSAERSVYR